MDNPLSLFAPKSFWAATDEERWVRCNGCGTKGLGGWIVPDTLWGLDITFLCNIHDWMYSEGKTIEDKEEADRSFLNNMVRLIDAKSSRWLRWIRRSRAMSYYSAVRDFGGPAFWSGKNPANTIRTVS